MFQLLCFVWKHKFIHERKSEGGPEASVKVSRPVGGDEDDDRGDGDDDGGGGDEDEVYGGENSDDDENADRGRS